MKPKTWIAVLTLVMGIGVVYMFYGSSNEHIQEITTAELEIKLKNDDQAMFIDVREVDEYNEAHIRGMTNIPLSRLANEYSLLPKDQEIVIFCRSGNRSMQAANFLAEQGYGSVTNVNGGILAWNGPLVTK